METDALDTAELSGGWAGWIRESAGGVAFQLPSL